MHVLVIGSFDSFSGANIGICWLRAHALGAERDVEVKLLSKKVRMKREIK